MSFSSESDQFSKSIEQFLIICENSVSDFVRHREKLNNVLNDLNSFDFKYAHKIECRKVSRITIAICQSNFNIFCFV